MLHFHPSLKSALAKAAVGLALLSFTLGSETLAGAMVTPQPGSGSSGPCSAYPLASGGNAQVYVDAAEAPHR
jgi:hypothetical protein